MYIGSRTSDALHKTNGVGEYQDHHQDRHQDDHQGHEGDVEHGRRDFIWPKTARKLADALGVGPDDLYR
jgi:hypothetical protein